MKKMFLVVLLLVSSLFPQQDNKGSISLTYNGEKIDLPISTVNISKENGILLSIGAEQSNAEVQKTVDLVIGLKKLSADSDAETLEGTKINIVTKDKLADTGSEFYIRFADSKDTSEAAYYGVITKGEEQKWYTTSVSLEINITEVKYDGETLNISGECRGTFKSKDAPEGQIAEIKDCTFHIII